MGIKLNILDFAIYRWRYNLGHIAVAVLFFALLIIAGFFIPGGISEGESQSVIKSAMISASHFSPDMAINLPYQALQKLSIAVLGVTTISIKLPSLLIALATGIGIMFLLEKWFKKNTAILTTLLAVTTGPFLLIAQSGTPDILYIFWPTYILLAGSALTHKIRFSLLWKIILFASIALSLYTPLGIYILTAIILACIFHPHVRHTVLTLSKARLAIALLISIILAVPLIYSVVVQPSVGVLLLGIPPSIDIVTNLHQLASQYLNFAHPTNGAIASPVYELATVLVMLIGMYRLTTTRYTGRSYIITAWLLITAAIAIINPSLVAATFIPALLLIGYGVDYLIRFWYQLFPRNPYARAAGLIPLVIFIVSITVTGIDRFVYGYLYDPASAQAFSKDLTLLSRERRSHPDTSAILLVATPEKPFYDVVKRYNSSWKIADVTDVAQDTVNEDILIVTHRALRPSLAPYQIITGSTKSAADRFYLYKSDSK